MFVIAVASGERMFAAPPAVQVDAILEAKFKRVEGAETGGASIYPGATSTWSDHSVGSPTIDFDGHVWRMWFVGMSMTDDPGIPYGFEERIGLATSTDGVRWKIANEGRSVLDFGAKGKFDDAGLSHPFVLRVGDQYMMWYGGIDGRSGKDVGVEPAHVRVEQIGLATSKDGVHWTRANNGDPVLSIGSKGTIDSIQATGCHVIKRGDQFVMWYGAYNGTHTIGLATSQDGIHWQKGNGGQSLPGLHGPKQLGPSVYFDASRYVMFYNTIRKTSNGGTQWTLYAATSADGIQWKPALDNKPVLGPAPPGNFGSADGKTGNNHAVHPTKMIVRGDRVRIWYGAEGSKPLPGRRYAASAIGLMEGRITP
ncbi:MAG: hypothetical protein CMJ64_15620 [Planctomycetaceae bacterium]|nr:hypothetical protein [Planctomycetaceae bacterium]